MKLHVQLKKYLKKILFPGSEKYWERRYVRGGKSGGGSYDRLSEFKGEIINSFMKGNGINSVMDFGCGDGNQLSLLDCPNYIGLDVSETAVESCKKRFQKDTAKSFILYDPDHFGDDNPESKANLSLSLDVIYHLVEDHIFEQHVKHLFSASNRFVIIYSSDFDLVPEAPHIKHRQFSKYVETNLPEWKLIEKIKNRYPDESCAEFFIYEKIKG